MGKHVVDSAAFVHAGGIRLCSNPIVNAARLLRWWHLFGDKKRHAITETNPSDHPMWQTPGRTEARPATCTMEMFPNASTGPRKAHKRRT